MLSEYFYSFMAGMLKLLMTRLHVILGFRSEVIRLPRFSTIILPCYHMIIFII